MKEDHEKKEDEQGYLDLGVIQQYVMHMLVDPLEGGVPNVVLYPYVSKDEIDPTDPPIPIEVRRFLQVRIERRTRSIIFMAYDTDTDRRHAILLGEKALSKLILDLQLLLGQLQKIPITHWDRFP